MREAERAEARAGAWTTAACSVHRTQPLVKEECQTAHGGLLMNSASLARPWGAVWEMLRARKGPSTSQDAEQRG